MFFCFLTGYQGDDLEILLAEGKVSALVKKKIMEKTGLELQRLNALLLLLIENNIIAFETNGISGYKISGHCGVAAYMVLAATHILSKKRYSASEFFRNCEI